MISVEDMAYADANSHCQYVRNYSLSGSKVIGKKQQHRKICLCVVHLYRIDLEVHGLAIQRVSWKLRHFWWSFDKELQ